MSQYINPFIKITLTFLWLFFEKRQCQVDEAKLVGSLLLALLICQYDVCSELVYFACLWHIVHEANCVYRQKLIGILILSLALIYLFQNTSAGIADGAIQKIGLPLVLHFQDESLASVGFAENIVDNASLIFGLKQLLLVFKYYVLDLELSLQQIVEKANQQILAEFLTEEALEAPIGEGVDVLCHLVRF